MPVEVLVIDDDSDIRLYLCSRLNAEGIETIEAENGEVGLAVLTTSASIQTVITDVQMPVMNGVEFLKAARAIYPGVPIYVMTSFSPYSAEEILRLGATRYFEKSDLRSLLDLVASNLMKP